MKLTKKDAVDVLKAIVDHKLHLDILKLGRVYSIIIGNNNRIDITMTLTSPACPYGPTPIAEVTSGVIEQNFRNPGLPSPLIRPGSQATMSKWSEDYYETA